MVEKTKGMGRGLAAILAVAPNDEEEELRQLPVEMISANPRQPRRQFDEESLLSLADSIRARGVIQPVLVRPLAGGTYELVAGERRWRAARIAELETIPAVVRERDDADSLELAVIENMAREDLNPVEEARACAGLVEELGLTREEVGLRVGRSRVAVSNLMRLLDLPDEALELLERRQLARGTGGRCFGLRQRDTPKSGASGCRERLVRSGARGAGTRRQTRPVQVVQPRLLPRTSLRAVIRTRLRRSSRSPTPSRRALGVEVTVRGTARGLHGPDQFSLPEGSGQIGPPPAALTGAKMVAPHGRLAQSVRALL